MHNWLNHWSLALVTFLPLLGAAVMMAIPKSEEQLHKTVALGTALATLLVGLWIFFNFDYGNGGLQFVIDKGWIDTIHSRFIMGIDGLSLPLFGLTLAVVPLVFIYSWNHIPEPGNPKVFLALMLILETGMIGSFLAEDLILFFVFFEVVLLPMYFMIGVWGGPERQYASIKFFLYTLFGSALMIISFLALYFLVKVPGGEALNQIHQLGGPLANVKSGSLLTSFDIRALHLSGGSGIVHGTQLVIFGGMFVGFGVKVPMFPFHTWLPDAHTQAPTQGSVILAAVLLKLGTYGFVRIAISVLPGAAKSWAPVIGVLAVIGIIYGALGCLAQTDMKRLIAFSSVAHMGYVMLGISTLTRHGINAAMFGMVAHGLITGMLFFVAGSVKERYHTLEIKRLGGLLVQAPRMGWILGFATMASLGLPGLAGFWGEFPAIMAAFNPAAGLSVALFRTLMVIAAVGTVLAAGYLLWLFQRTAFGTPKDEFANDPHIHDVVPSEWLAWSPFLAAILIFGVAPGLMFDITEKALVALHLGA